jgi:hypothetical protein
MVGASNPAEITRRRVILLPLAWRLWRIYDDALEPVNRTTPCRQSFQCTGFLRLMADPRVLKIIIGATEITGLAAATRQFRLLPWISEAYFKSLEHRDRRKFAYVPILVVRNDRRGSEVAPALFRELRAACANTWGVRDLGFDVCATNAALPSLMRRALDDDARIVPIGAQRYFHATDSHGVMEGVDLGPKLNDAGVGGRVLSGTSPGSRLRPRCSHSKAPS